MVQNFKLRVLTLITRLSDRDTYVSAAAELESMARKLDSSSIQSFLSSILSIGPQDKLPARRHCLHLISLLSVLYPANVTPNLPKILAFIFRRLRDSDSSVIRPQYAATSTSLAKNLTQAGFFVSFAKPMSEAMFTEQEANSQLGVAMCLSAAIEASADPEAEKWGKPMTVKLVRFLKSDGYRWKVGALTVLGSVVHVGGTNGYSGLLELVVLLTGFLKNDDWATRRAAAEALRRIAVVEKEAVAELKSESLKAFEGRRFDKVKAAREVMTQMIEAWKCLPDVEVEASPPPKSAVSSADEETEIDENPKLRTGKSRKKINFEEKTQTPIASKKLTNRPMKKKALLICGKDDAVGPSIAEEVPKPLKSANGSMSSEVEPVDLNENQHTNRREGDDFSSIRNQLMQIQRQQSNLQSLVQSFMGTSQNGLRALESRVHGIEIVLDDLAVTTEKLAEPRRVSCCFGSGSGSLASKVRELSRRRASLVQRISLESMSNETRRLRLQSGLDFITNPLAEVQTQVQAHAQAQTLAHK